MKATDWEAYYTRPFPASSITRRITASRLIAHMRKFMPAANPKIIELGGANSCFVDAINAALIPASYTVVDNNLFGLSLLDQKRAMASRLRTVCDDVLQPRQQMTADIVFSVGLIEHFDFQGTKLAIDSHYRFTRSGGIVIICFPSPTWLYRLARELSEFLGLWKFPDEHPLKVSEIRSIMQQHGEVLNQDMIWPIVFTQGLLIGRNA